MDTVAAAENLSVELAPDAWRLQHNDLRGTHELLCAGPDCALRYSAAFAYSRRLPAGGALECGHIEQIVLGWSESDQAWQLGLLLAPQLARLRDSRWCELAHWPDPDQSDFRELAERVGRSLATLTARPFQLITPAPPEAVARPRHAVVADESPPRPERPLPPLPLTFNDSWSLENGMPGTLQLVRDPNVARKTTRRILWYLLWTAIYIFLIAASQLSGIAMTGPAFLPLLAALSALVLVALIARNLIRQRRSPDRFIFDSFQRQIRARRGQNVLWSRRAGQIQSIYVTELVRKKRGHDDRLQYAELNLHLSSNDFQHLLQSNKPRQIARELHETLPGVSELGSQDCHSNTQAVALHIAQTLDLPVWLDRRDA